MKTNILLFFAPLFIASSMYAQTEGSGDREIFMVVEEMPLFPGCEEVADYAARKKCADQKMNDYFSDHIQYPGKNPEGANKAMLVVRFVVGRTGETEPPEVKRKGDGLTEDMEKIALDAIRAMPAWNPGRQNGIAVDVAYTMPIRFRFD